MKGAEDKSAGIMRNKIRINERTDAESSCLLTAAVVE